MTHTIVHYEVIAGVGKVVTYSSYNLVLTVTMSYKLFLSVFRAWFSEKLLRWTDEKDIHCDSYEV